jgi:hypothetical protein
MLRGCSGKAQRNSAPEHHLRAYDPEETAHRSDLQLKWAEPLTLTRSEKILLEGPVGNMTGSALFWAKAGYLYLGLKTGRW